MKAREMSNFSSNCPRYLRVGMKAFHNLHEDAPAERKTLNWRGYTFEGRICSGAYSLESLSI